MITTWRLALGILAAALACGCDKPAIDYDGPVEDWPVYGGDPGGLRFSPLTQINPDNVSHLEVAWTYRSGDFSPGTDNVTRTSLQVTPIMVQDTLYFCTPFNRVIALDAESGEERWVFDPELELKRLHGAYPLTCRGVSHWQDDSTAGTCARRIFTATHDSELIALDANTGEPCPDFGTTGRVDLRSGIGEAPDWEYYTTSPPLVIHDLVVVGALVADNVRADAPGGVVRAFDARTGALRWAWDPTPPGRPPPAAGQPRYHRGTPNVWAVMSADPERDLVFVPTGNAPPDYFGGVRDGLDHYSSSVVALHASGEEAGTVAWSFQTVHHDVWDYDVGAQPTLFEFPDEDGTRPAVAVSTKMGHVFLLDRISGEPIFPVEERAVPQGGAIGERLAPTQPFPSRPPSLYPPQLTADDAFGLTFWDRGRCRRQIEQLRADGLFTPPTRQGSVHFPGALGGINWGGAAIDPERGIYVVNQSRVPTAVHLLTREEYEALPEDEREVKPGGLPGTTSLYGPQTGTPFAVKRQLLLSPFGMPCSKPPWGTLTAVDVASGSVLWEVPLGSSRGQAPWPLWFTIGVPNLGGPVITASGLVFIAATPDEYMRAFSLQSGEELWRTQLPFAGHATPLTYRLRRDGRQFVVIAAGGHAISEPGDAIVAFALP